MKKVMIQTILILAALLVSIGAFAQPGGIENPDPNPGGSGGGGDCKGCSYNYNNTASCGTYIDQSEYCYDYWGRWNPQCTMVNGYTTCVAHNAPVGPPFCEVSGSCSVVQVAAKAGSDTENQIAGIESYLRESGVISDVDLNDFIAGTDFTLRGEAYAVAAPRRLLAYRAEFNRLVARGDPLRELKPGSIPVMPRKPTKAPAATLAER